MLSGKRMPTYVITILIIISAVLALILIRMLPSAKGFQQAMRELPSVAFKLGLQLKQNEDSDGDITSRRAELLGYYEDRNVCVRPWRAMIEVGMNQMPDIDLAINEKPHRSVPVDMVHFDSGNKGFDKFFRKRLANPEIAEKLTRSASRLDYVGKFRRRWNRYLLYLDVTKDGIYCRVKYGHGTYIPASVLEALLPDLCRLAEVLEIAMDINTESGSPEREGPRDRHKKNKAHNKGK